MCTFCVHSCSGVGSASLFTPKRDGKRVALEEHSAGVEKLDAFCFFVFVTFPFEGPLVLALVSFPVRGRPIS